MNSSINTYRINQQTRNNSQQHQRMDVNMTDMDITSLRKAPKHSTSASPRSPHKRPKHIRFAESSVLIITQPKTPAEMASTWYNKAEVAAFKRDIKESSQSQCGTARAHAMRYIGHCIQTGEEQKPLDITGIEEFRGLEHLLSPEVCRVLLQRRRATMARVLAEQARQESQGIHDADRIAAVSLANSEFAREWRRRIMNL